VFKRGKRLAPFFFLFSSFIFLPPTFINAPFGYFCQIRVHTALKTWVDRFWVPEKDREALKPIKDFVAQEMMDALPGPAGRLLDTLNQMENKRNSINGGMGTSTFMKAQQQQQMTMHMARSRERLDQDLGLHSNISGTMSRDNGSNGSIHSTVSSNSTANNSNSSINSYRPFAATAKDKLANGDDAIRKPGVGGLTGRESIYGRIGPGPPAPQVNKALLNALSNEATMCKVPVTEIKPIELARQLTFMVGKLYNEIPYLELLVKERPNCSKMIQLSNKVKAKPV